MTDPRKPSLILPVAVTLTVLLGLYVGAYYLMVDRQFFDPHHGLPSRFLPVYSFSKAVPYYETDQRWVRFFAPIHRLDRRIRPHVWEPTP